MPAQAPVAPAAVCPSPFKSPPARARPRSPCRGFAALLDDLAARHHQVLVGQFGGEVVELLDQQDRHVAARRQAADDRADLLDHRRLDAFRGFVEDQQSRLAGQGAADRQLLLLAAGEVAAAALFHFAQDREQLVDEVRHRPGVPGAETGQSHQQVLFHRQPGEDFPSLRHVGDPGADPLVRPESGERTALPGDLALAGRDQAHQAAQQGGLAHPVATEQAGHLAHLRLEAQATEDMATAVVLVELVDLQHGSLPFVP